ncbi:MAG: hypothetical protein QOD00_3371 [Blastocatellia bacterium]|nr:hypothetical protein [Blastocatellia bacterium]
MKRFRFTFVLFSMLLLLLLATNGLAQKNATTGGIKGKVRAENGASVAGVNVIARQGEREVTRVSSNNKGDFMLAGLAPGRYGLTFRKPGLSVGTLEDIEVRAGKTLELPDRLILKVDEGTLAFLRGSVFNAAGRSVEGVRVELARLQADGTTKKLDSRISNETGSFVFRLTPEAAKYRVTVKADGTAPVSKDVEIDGAAVYRVALSLTSAPK